MMSLAAGKLRSSIVSFMLGVFVLTFLTSVCVLVTPNTAFAQEDEGEQPAEKGKTNPVVHFFKSIGIVFGLIFAAISVGMVALIIILLVPLALRGVAYRAAPAADILRGNLLIYGVGGIIVPFIGIKAIDVVITMLGLA